MEADALISGARTEKDDVHSAVRKLYFASLLTMGLTAKSVHSIAHAIPDGSFDELCSRFDIINVNAMHHLHRNFFNAHGYGDEFWKRTQNMLKLPMTPLELEILVYDVAEGKMTHKEMIPYRCPLMLMEGLTLLKTKIKDGVLTREEVAEIIRRVKSVIRLSKMWEESKQKKPRKRGRPPKKSTPKSTSCTAKSPNTNPKKKLRTKSPKRSFKPSTKDFDDTFVSNPESPTRDGSRFPRRMIKKAHVFTPMCCDGVHGFACPVCKSFCNFSCARCIICNSHVEYLTGIGVVTKRHRSEAAGKGPIDTSNFGISNRSVNKVIKNDNDEVLESISNENDDATAETRVDKRGNEISESSGVKSGKEVPEIITAKSNHKIPGTSAEDERHKKGICKKSNGGLVLTFKIPKNCALKSNAKKRPSPESSFIEKEASNDSSCKVGVKDTNSSSNKKGLSHTEKFQSKPKTLQRRRSKSLKRSLSESSLDTRKKTETTYCNSSTNYKAKLNSPQNLSSKSKSNEIGETYSTAIKKKAPDQDDVNSDLNNAPKSKNPLSTVSNEKGKIVLRDKKIAAHKKLESKLSRKKKSQKESSSEACDKYAFNNSTYIEPQPRASKSKIPKKSGSKTGSSKVTAPESNFEGSINDCAAYDKTSISSVSENFGQVLDNKIIKQKNHKPTSVSCHVSDGKRGIGLVACKSTATLNSSEAGTAAVSKPNFPKKSSIEAVSDGASCDTETLNHENSALHLESRLKNPSQFVPEHNSKKNQKPEFDGKSRSKSKSDKKESSNSNSINKNSPDLHVRPQKVKKSRYQSDGRPRRMISQVNNFESICGEDGEQGFKCPCCKAFCDFKSTQCQACNSLVSYMPGTGVVTRRERTSILSTKSKLAARLEKKQNYESNIQLLQGKSDLVRKRLDVTENNKPTDCKKDLGGSMVESSHSSVKEFLSNLDVRKEKVSPVQAKKSKLAIQKKSHAGSNSKLPVQKKNIPSLKTKDSKSHAETKHDLLVRGKNLGICPWCDKRFKSLEIHIGKMHPDRSSVNQVCKKRKRRSDFGTKKKMKTDD